MQYDCWKHKCQKWKLSWIFQGQVQDLTIKHEEDHSDNKKIGFTFIAHEGLVWQTVGIHWLVEEVKYLVYPILVSNSK